MILKYREAVKIRHENDPFNLCFELCRRTGGFLNSMVLSFFQAMHLWTSAIFWGLKGSSLSCDWILTLLIAGEWGRCFRSANRRIHHHELNSLKLIWSSLFSMFHPLNRVGESYNRSEINDHFHSVRTFTGTRLLAAAHNICYLWIEQGTDSFNSVYSMPCLGCLVFIVTGWNYCAIRYRFYPYWLFLVTLQYF